MLNESAFNDSNDSLKTNVV